MFVVVGQGHGRYSHVSFSLVVVVQIVLGGTMSAAGDVWSKSNGDGTPSCFEDHRDVRAFNFAGGGLSRFATAVRLTWLKRWITPPIVQCAAVVSRQETMYCCPDRQLPLGVLPTCSPLL